MKLSKYPLALALGTIAIIGLTGRPASAQLAMPTCAITSSSSIAFGSYSVFNASPTDSTGTIAFICSNASGPVTISLTGVQPTGTRKFMNGADVLTYHVFTDAARTRPWGDGTFGAAAASFSTPTNNTTVTAVMYGRIFARQDVAFGAYSDSLVATISF